MAVSKCREGRTPSKLVYTMQTRECELERVYQSILSCTKCDTHQLGLCTLYSKWFITKTKLQHRCMWHHWSCSDTGYRPCAGSLFTLLGPVCDPVVWQFLWQPSNFSLVKFIERTGLQGETHHHTIGASGRGCRLQCNSADGGYTTTWPQRSRPEKQVCKNSIQPWPADAISLGAESCDLSHMIHCTVSLSYRKLFNCIINCYYGFDQKICNLKRTSLWHYYN